MQAHGADVLAVFGRDRVAYISDHDIGVMVAAELREHTGPGAARDAASSAGTRGAMMVWRERRGRHRDLPDQPAPQRAGWREARRADHGNAPGRLAAAVRAGLDEVPVYLLACDEFAAAGYEPRNADMLGECYRDAMPEDDAAILAILRDADHAAAELFALDIH